MSAKKEQKSSYFLIMVSKSDENIQNLGCVMFMFYFDTIR